MPVFSVYEQGGRSIRMQAVLSGVNMPVSTVKLGREIKLQIIYNKGTSASASSAFGKYSLSLSLSLSAHRYSSLQNGIVDFVKNDILLICLL